MMSNNKTTKTIDFMEFMKSKGYEPTPYMVIEQQTDDCIWYSATKVFRTDEQVVADGTYGYESGSHTGLIWQELYSKQDVDQTILFFGLTKKQADKIKSTLIEAAAERYHRGKGKMILNSGGKYLKKAS